MNLNFNMPVHLVTGRDCVRENAAVFGKLGKRAMIITGGNSAKRSGALADVTAALDSQGIAWSVFDEVRQNPLLSTCKRAGRLAAQQGADFLIGIGGGSPLDSTKAIAIFAANDIPDEEIFNLDWKNPALPFILVGTTAGTASEMTNYSIMTIDRTNRKQSFGCQQTYAAWSFGDPKYTYSLPIPFTLSTTLDALAHALEGYYSTMANTLSDLFAIEAVKTLLPVYRELAAMGDDIQVSEAQRDQLYFGSLLAGFPLNHCGTCYCHTIGYFLSESYGVPHGFACAATLPDFVERGERALPEKARALYTGANTSREELLSLIAQLNRGEFPTFDRETADAISSRWDDSVKNFLKSPGNFTAADAQELVRRCFVR